MVAPVLAQQPAATLVSLAGDVSVAIQGGIAYAWEYWHDLA